MYISDRERSQFTEIYIRTCRTRDSLYILPGLTILEGLGCKQAVVRDVWLLCDRESKGRLKFGEFLVACYFCSHVKYRHDLPPTMPPQMDRYLDCQPPIPVYWAEDQEKAELAALDGMDSAITSEAFKVMDDAFTLLREATCRVLCLLSHNPAHHEAIRARLDPGKAVSRLRGPLSVEARRCVAMFLSAVSSTDSLWLGDHVMALTHVTINSEEDADIRRMVMGSIANCVANITACNRLLYQVSGRLNILCQRINESVLILRSTDMLFELLRFYRGIQACEDENLLIEVFILFYDTLFAEHHSFLHLFDEKCAIVLFDLLRLSIATSVLRVVLVEKLEVIAHIYAELPGNVRYARQVCPRLALVLSGISRTPAERPHFVHQGGLDMVLELYFASPSDEIVRLNCVLAATHLLDWDEFHKRGGPYANKLRAMLQDACEQETHFEILTKAFDAWLLLAAQAQEWGTATLTAASFLLSESLELKIKAIAVLGFLLNHPDQRLLFMGITDECKQGSERFLSPLFSCIPQRGPAGTLQYTGVLNLTDVGQDLAEECIDSILRCCNLLILDQTPSVIQLVESSRLSNKIYNVFPFISAVGKCYVRISLGILFTRDTRIQRRLLSELTSSGLPSGIDIVMDGICDELACISGILALMRDAGFVDLLSGHISHIYSSLTQMLEKDVDSAISTGLSECVGLFCNHTDHARVACQLEKHDMVSILIRMIGSRSSVHVAIWSILSLVRYNKNRWLLDLSRPSRLHAIGTLLRTNLHRAHILDILHSISEASEAHAQLVTDALGQEVSFLIEAATTLNRTSDLALVNCLLQSDRIKRLLVSHGEFMGTTIASSTLKGLEEILTIPNREKFAGTEKIKRLVEIIQILGEVAPELAHANQGNISLAAMNHVLQELPLTAFLRVDLSVISRMKPPLAGIPSPQHRVVFSLLKLVEYALVSHRSTKGPLGTTSSHFKSKLAKFTVARETHRSIYGETVFSNRLGEFISTCERMC